MDSDATHDGWAVNSELGLKEGAIAWATHLWLKALNKAFGLNALLLHDFAVKLHFENSHSSCTLG